MSIPEDQPSMLELIELSDLTWTIIDPAGEHESVEQGLDRGAAGRLGAS